MNLTIKLKGLCALLPLAATVNAASLNRRITSYNVCYTKLLRFLHYFTHHFLLSGKSNG